MTDNQDFILHVRALFKKQTMKYSQENVSKVFVLNVQI